MQLCDFGLARRLSDIAKSSVQEVALVPVVPYSAGLLPFLLLSNCLCKLNMIYILVIVMPLLFLLASYLGYGLGRLCAQIPPIILTFCI
jgi:hypothetical protein